MVGYEYTSLTREATHEASRKASKTPISRNYEWVRNLQAASAERPRCKQILARNHKQRVRAQSASRQHQRRSRDIKHAHHVT